jgi:hypothetical protein
MSKITVETLMERYQISRGQAILRLDRLGMRLNKIGETDLHLLDECHAFLANTEQSLDTFVQLKTQTNPPPAMGKAIEPHSATQHPAYLGHLGQGQGQAGQHQGHRERGSGHPAKPHPPSPTPDSSSCQPTPDPQSLPAPTPPVAISLQSPLKNSPTAPAEHKVAPAPSSLSGGDCPQPGLSLGKEALMADPPCPEATAATAPEDGVDDPSADELEMPATSIATDLTPSMPSPPESSAPFLGAATSPSWASITDAEIEAIRTSAAHRATGKLVVHHLAEQHFLNHPELLEAVDPELLQRVKEAKAQEAQGWTVGVNESDPKSLMARMFGSISSSVPQPTPKPNPSLAA